MRKINEKILEFKGECESYFIGSEHKKKHVCFGKIYLYQMVSFLKRGAC